MTGYTKLFGSILTSTIWRESKETKVLWITMLALANKAGVVEASIPGLAHIANITMDECQAALAGLESPDPYSRTKDYEGRRIQTIDGGWQILNYLKYRDKLSDIQKREYMKLKQREFRKSVKEGLTPLTCQQMSTVPYASASASEERKEEGVQGKGEGKPAEPPKVESLPEEVQAWNEVGCFPKVIAVSGPREKILTARHREPFWTENWRAGLERIAKSSFCRGTNDRGWVANFDFFIRANSLTQILEGKYDDRTPQGNRATGHVPIDHSKGF